MQSCICLSRMLIRALPSGELLRFEEAFGKMY